MTNDHWRLAIFLSVFAIMALWEKLRPKRELVRNRPKRWTRNLAITALSSLAARFLLPMTAIGAALWAERSGVGLLRIAEISDQPLGLVIAIISLDFCIYCQHVAFHTVGPLWRLHSMHHADEDFDVTTGARFHPIEIILSMMIKCTLVVAIGVAPLAVLIFEILLNAAAMFNHSNVALPHSIDKVLRWFVVTPDMHRIHHSDRREETNANYGFNFPWWDRVFGTYIDQPAAGHQQMRIGLAGVVDREEWAPLSLLALPFVTKGAREAVGRTRAMVRVTFLGLFVLLLSIGYWSWHG